MRTIIILLIAIVVGLHGYSQSLSPERVAIIKSATVRITIDSSDKMGTGFFISKTGTLVTCWHVVFPSLVLDTRNNIKSQRKITAELSDGTLVYYQIKTTLLSNNALLKQAINYDFAVLEPINKLNKIIDTLKLGSYEKAKEGEEIYTCGYPIGIPYQFISKGIISTKFTDTNKIKNALIDVALLDITLNKGNSGGAIVKLGKTINEDEVIGIASFIINPIGRLTDSLTNSFSKEIRNANSRNSDPFDIFTLLTNVLDHTSIGVSGCISLSHLQKTMGYK